MSALLEAHDSPAERDGDAAVGIFGPGLQGATSHGVTILVPAQRPVKAQAVLEQPREFEYTEGAG